jgi:hypothetical protein
VRRQSALSSAMKEAKRRCQRTTTRALAEGLKGVRRRNKVRPFKREALDDDFVAAAGRKSLEDP